MAQLDIGGNPYLGIFCAANEDFALVPIDMEKRHQNKLSETLKIEVVPILIAGSRLIGSLLVMNSTGAIVNNFVETSELLKLKKFINVTILDDKLNAIGNNILTNDKAALVHTQFSQKSIKEIEETLDVEVMKGTIAGQKTVGTTAVITKSGGLCHPKVTKEELENLKAFFKTDIITGTANYGAPLIGACLIANSKGVVTGTTTTGIELGRIEDGFNLL
ncbi:translation initiation factor IF-6 [[Eubacterium] cellulosolvens]